ncbi:hypothetical protein OG864_23315 [Streptomyces sp. NBC_00124]|uniref:DUF6817 domain-containing protein n=1 Tax=Streptomyces sp. NBC_00124 TaxID=2975662 RepID=UPI00225AB462|nr:hypothetical protein [Streptomyces sp. NBC_00124]MCX5361642.1 hypothetical protein [Streptomyces sp. NBC_00124]
MAYDSMAQADSLLRELGAERLPHPGGTLLTHLHRVRTRLATWNARPALQLAGLCHAFYGTDGFAQVLLPLDRRSDLVATIGEEAEAIVYFYASCDRKATYPTLADPGSPFHARFTGRAYVPGPALRQDFAELTAANEIDLAAEDPAFRDRHGPDLLALFTRFRTLLSRPAYEDCLSVLLGPTPLHGP